MTASVQPRDEDAAAEAGPAGRQAERDAPPSGQERIKQPGRRRIRRSAVALLVALSCILVLLSTTVVWAHRTLLNTGTFVGTVGPVFQDPAVASAVATRATDELFTQLDLKTRLRDALPPKASFAAAPVTTAAEGYVAGELTKVLTSPQFQAIWTQALTTTHQQLVAVLRGQHTPVLSTSDGYIVLNTLPLINQALGKVSGLASDLTGKPVTLPTITSADPPQQAVNKLSKALGAGHCRATCGEVTLVRSSDLGTVRQLVKDSDALTVVLPLVTILLIALSLWLSVNRRRTRAPAGGRRGPVDDCGEARRTPRAKRAGERCSQPPGRAGSVLGDLLHGFFVLTAWVLAVAVVVLVIAVLCGPYRWAVAMRSWVKRTGRSVAGARRGGRRGPAVDWIASHAAGLQLAGAVVAGILLLIVSVSWLSFLIIGVLLAACEVYLQRIKPAPPDESSPASKPGHQADLPSGMSQT